MTAGQLIFDRPYANWSEWNAADRRDLRNYMRRIRGRVEYRTANDFEYKLHRDFSRWRDAHIGNRWRARKFLAAVTAYQEAMT